MLINNFTYYLRVFIISGLCIVYISTYFKLFFYGTENFNFNIDRAVQENLISTNPVLGCKMTTFSQQEMKVLGREEVQRVLIQAKEEGFYELFALEVTTGLRRGVLQINKQACPDHGKVAIRASKTAPVSGASSSPSGSRSNPWTQLCGQAVPGDFEAGGLSSGSVSRLATHLCYHGARAWHGHQDAVHAD